MAVSKEKLKEAAKTKAAKLKEKTGPLYKYSEHACAVGYAMHEFHLFGSSHLLAIASGALLIFLGLIVTYKGAQYLIELLSSGEL